MDIDVGGQQFRVGRDTLTQVQGSLLTALFSETAQVNLQDGKNVFLDRDPDVFSHVITFLRSGRKTLPEEITDEMKENIQNEIQYWQIDKGLYKIYKYVHQDLQKLSELLQSKPKLRHDTQWKYSLDTWKTQSPLTIEEII